MNGITYVCEVDYYERVDDWQFMLGRYISDGRVISNGKELLYVNK